MINATARNGWRFENPTRGLTTDIEFEWDVDGDDPEELWAEEDGEIILSCGPSMKPEEGTGWLSDTTSVYGELKKLLPYAEIGIYENAHAIDKSQVIAHFGLGADAKLEDVKPLVEKVLKDAGIIEHKEEQ